MIEKHYNGGLTREQFLFFEIRIVSSLVLQGKSRNEIEQEIFSENLFQFPTEKMIKNITKTCLKRIDALNAPELVYHLANASLDVAKQINLYAIMCENRIVYDFLTEVIGENIGHRILRFPPRMSQSFSWNFLKKCLLSIHGVLLH